MHRSLARLRRVAVVLLLLGSASGAARAQGTAITGGIGASIDILFPPLTGVGTRPLDFGIIIPGTPSVTVAPRTPAGGEFRIAGAMGRANFFLLLNLPTTLAGPAGATMPLDFNGNYAALCELNAAGVCQAASVTTWNPSTTFLFTATPYRYTPTQTTFKYDQLDIYLGGRVLPAAGQRPGVYTGAVNVFVLLN